MDMTQILFYLAIGIALGAGIIFVTFNLVEKSILSEAQADADEVLKDAQENFQLEEAERQERVQEIELELWGRVEEQHLGVEEKCKDLDELIQTKKKLYEEADKQNRQALMQNETDLRNLSIHLSEVQKQFQTVKDQLETQKEVFRANLLGKSSLTSDDVIGQIKDKFISDFEADAEKKLQAVDEELKNFAEAKAKRILGYCIERFSKEMSTERHISSSFFPNEQIRALFCVNLRENVAMLQEITGCDILIDPEPEPDRMLNVQVIGYDPVRRELTRRIFEKIFRDTEKSNKPTDPQYIKRVSENLKNELVKQIKKDGELMAKELGFVDMHPEIKQVIGSLRYRYSYTQNQYFHVGEVGWFASLLAAELRVDIRTAKRAGFLHDLGKALDHEFDGSHAVIGADFIAARQEAVDVVYAVRAHHYDVQPEKEMDFLVIAADAISGGRPGARRSTMETYNQKVTGLQEIARRYRGVTDIFVLNGGRECRVLVNSRVLDDVQSMEVAGQIAKTIEDEMQYPGQIKVVVVRETVVSESRHHEKRK